MNNEDYELTLFDRLEVIKQTVMRYGEDKFYLSFSGGKDSTTLHHLIDMALPNNQIPRVYSDTGIELTAIRNFVMNMASKDKRIIMLRPHKPIKQTLEEFGYPFKSKMHSYMVEKYQRLGLIKGVKNYIGKGEKTYFRPCPKKLLYQFTKDFKLKISDACCLKMKEEPMQNWATENNRTIAITGIMREEGGRRVKASCITIRGGEVKFFNPLAKITKEFEDWFIKTYGIKLASVYYPPYNLIRTGCKGCPFAQELQSNLDMLAKYFPNERKQCELIWRPVYDEYRRLNYRLKGEGK